MTEYLIRFVVGGVVVSLFAALGELFQPKRFAGIFGAAPSIALGSIALAFHSHGVDYVVVECKAMIAGALAFTVYAGISARLCEHTRAPVWLDAGAAWAAWGASAAALVWTTHRADLL